MGRASIIGRFHVARLAAVFALCSLNGVAVDSRADEPATPAPAPAPPSTPPTPIQVPVSPLPVATQRTETVEIRGNADDERRNSTVMKTVINADEIERYGEYDLLGVLKRQPGVIVMNGRVSLHGLFSGTQVLLDGEAFPAGLDLDSLPPDLVARIEIYPAATAEFGTGAMAGTINIVLKKTFDKDLRNFSLGITHADNALFSNGSASLAGHLDNLTWLLAANINRSASTSRVDVETLGRDVSGQPDLLWLTTGQSRMISSASSLLPRLDWKFASGDTLTLKLSAAHRQSRFQSEEMLTAVIGPLPYRDGQFDIRNHTDSASLAIGYEAKAFGDARFETHLSLSENHRTAHTTQYEQDEGGNAELDRTVNSTSSAPGMSISSKISKPLEGGHSLVFGIEEGTARTAETRRLSDVTPASPVASTQDQSFDSRIRSMTAFGQDEWDVTPRFGVYLGLRRETIVTRVSGAALGDIDHRSDVWSPILQALWKLPDTQSDQLRVAVADSYRSPTAFELSPKRSMSPQNSPVNPDSQGNPDLRPELTTGLDFSYEHALDAGGLLGPSAYVREVHGIIRRRVDNVDGVWIDRPYNLGDALVRGITLEARFDPSSLSVDMPKADVYMNLMRNASRVNFVPGPYNRIDGQAPFAANAGVDYKLPQTAWTLGGNFNLTGSVISRTSITDSRYASAHRDLGVYAMWRYDRDIRWRLTLSNLLGSKSTSTELYQATTSLEQSSRSYAPRAARLDLNLKL